MRGVRDRCSNKGGSDCVEGVVEMVDVIVVIGKKMKQVIQMSLILITSSNFLK